MKMIKHDTCACEAIVELQFGGTPGKLVTHSRCDLVLVLLQFVNSVWIKIKP